MTTMFDWCMEHVLQVEGGFSNRADDLGGPTNFGLSQKFLKQAYPHGIWDAATIQAMTLEQAKAIYKQFFWDPHAAALQTLITADFKLAAFVFDTLINSSPQWIKFLQLTWKLPADGVLGPATTGMIIKAGKLEYGRLRCNYYAGLARHDYSQLDNLGGWLNRVFYYLSL